MIEDFQVAFCAIMFSRSASSVKAVEVVEVTRVVEVEVTRVVKAVEVEAVEVTRVVEVTRAVKVARCSCRCCLTLRWAWRVSRMKWLRTKRSELHDYSSAKRLSTT